MLHLEIKIKIQRNNKEIKLTSVAYNYFINSKAVLARRKRNTEIKVAMMNI